MEIPGVRTRELKFGELRIRFHPLIFLCLCSSLGMFISLGFWQLERAAEKQTMADELRARAVAEPVPLSSMDVTATPGNMTRVTLAGEYQNGISFLLLFQFFQGQAGYEVLTPFKPADGSELILVSRGWIGAGASAERPVIPEVDGQQQLRGQIYVPEFESPAAEVTDTDWPVRLTRLNVAQAGRLLGEPVFPWIIRLEANQPGVLQRHWTPPRLGTRGHFGYALQWFGIALLVAVAALFYASNLAKLINARP
jgi:surfeit locus 1 family protein